MTDVGKCPRERIGADDDERCARDLSRRVKVRIDPTVRQKEDEDRHADQSAADADQRAERANEKSEQKE